MRDENGLEKCVACGLCAVACPADAIYLEAAENDGSVQAGPRYAKVYQIHKTRCIFCGYCEEACPVSAIFMGKDYELAVYSNKDFIWDKTDLLVRRQRASKPVLARPGVVRRARRHPRRLSTRRAASLRATPTCRSGCVSATSPMKQGRYESLGAPVYWIQGNNDNFDAIAAGDAAGRSPSHRERHASMRFGRRCPRCRARRHLRADVVRDARGRPAASEEGQRQGDGTGRQAASLRPRRGRRLPAAARRRRVHDARSREPFRPFPEGRGPDAGKTQINEILRRCNRGCTCSDTITASRNRPSRASARSASIS